MTKLLSQIFSILTSNEKKKFYILTACSMLVSFVDIASLAGVLFIIRFYTQPLTGSINFLPQWLSNQHSIALAMVFLILYLIKNIAAHYIHTLQYRFVYNVASRLSRRNMLQYLQSNYDAHVHIDSAVYIRSVSQQPVEFAHYVLAGAQQIISEAALVLLSIIAILWYNAALFAVVAALLLPGALALWLYTRKKIAGIRNSVQTQSANALQHLKEALAGYVESNIYGRNIFFTNRYAQSQQALNSSLAGLQTIQGVPARLMEVFAVFGLLVLIVVANTPGLQQLNSIILLGAFMAAAYKIIPGLVRIINAAGQIKAYRFTISALVESKQQKQPINSNENITTINKIAFSNISFAYNNKQVISCLNAQINTGDFVGIPAASGKGKTTLVNILLGLIQEDEGHICINESRVDAEGRKQYWNRIAYVKQQNFLIHDTIEKNIVLSDEVYDEVKLKAVLHTTGLDAFVHKFDEGIQKIISENGKNISGGQRQRIAIARALYKESDVIILDEPFNELDSASEQMLLNHFKILANKGKIIILITHQQSSLSYCNKIISLHG